MLAAYNAKDNLREHSEQVEVDCVREILLADGWHIVEAGSLTFAPGLRFNEYNFEGRKQENYIHAEDAELITASWYEKRKKGKDAYSVKLTVPLKHILGILEIPFPHDNWDPYTEDAPPAP